jgi:hypothetical protein
VNEAPAVDEIESYDDLHPWAVALCEDDYAESLAGGRRRRKASRTDFVAGWKEAARRFGRLDVFVDGSTI